MRTTAAVSGMPNTAETERCEACEQAIPAERAWLHARGLDGARPECPKTDLVEIALRARVEWDGRSEWDQMRARYAANPRTR
jgi:hypothetical protein